MGVLLQNFSDMKGFLVILCTLVVAAAVMFLLLFATHPCVRDADACYNGLIEADDFDEDAERRPSPMLQRPASMQRVPSSSRPLRKLDGLSVAPLAKATSPLAN